MSVARFSGTIYPDMSFSLGICPNPKKEKDSGKCKISNKVLKPSNLSGIELWHKKTFQEVTEDEHFFDPIEQKNYCLKHAEGRERDIYVLQQMDYVTDGDFSQFYDVEPPSEAPLLVKSLKSSRTKRKPYGENGITTYGRKVVKNGTLLLERKYSKNRLGFVTCSLPNLPKEEHHLLNGLWGEVVRRFYQKVKRQLEKVDKPFHYVGVTEIQEKRFKKYDIPAPHLHFVYLAKNLGKCEYWIYICHLHRAWNEAIQETLIIGGSTYSLESHGSWGSTHAKRVQKSAAAYLGKYMSKGCKVLEKMLDSGWVEFPRQWWTASKSVKKLFKESLISIRQETAEWFFYDNEELYRLNAFAYMQSVWIEYGGESYRVGITGTLSKELYEAIKETG